MSASSAQFFDIRASVDCRSLIEYLSQTTSLDFTTMLSLISAAAAIGMLTSTGAATPTCKNTQVANFDDLTGIPGTILNPIPVPYKGLQYQGFTFANTISTGGLLPGVAPKSTPNYAISNAVTESTQGTAMLTTNYIDGPTGATFDLKSFYYGCVVQLLNGATAVPTQCTISIAGYQGNDNTIANSKQVCAQAFQYNPTSALGLQNSAFTGPIDPECKDLNFVQVQYTLPGGLSAADATLGITIDDVVYDLDTCKA